MLVEAGVAHGREVTSWPSVRTDLPNAGAKWQDWAVVVDEGIVTSRKPAGLPEFIAKIVEEVEEGRHGRAAGPSQRRIAEISRP
jgi:deglycase